MNAKLQKIATLTLITASIATTGCTGLPWRKKQVPQPSAAEQYAEQAMSNIDYRISDVDFAQDNQSGVQTSQSYTSPPKSSSPSGGSGSCCH